MITKGMPETEADPFDLSAAGHLCFFCGEFLTDPAVQWHGFHDGSGNVYLHGECVIEWLPRLMRDALELRYRHKPWDAPNHA